MKTLVLSLLALTLPVLSYAQDKQCLPIYITNSGVMQSLLRSEAYGAVDPLNELKLEGPAMVDVEGISIRRKGIKARARVQFLIERSGASAIHYAAFFEVNQTCDGRLESRRVHGNDDAL